MNIIVEKPTRVEVPDWLWREVRLGGSKEVKITLPDEEDEAEEEAEPEPQPAVDPLAEQKEKEKQRLAEEAEKERIQKEKDRLAAEEAEKERQRKQKLAAEEAEKERLRREKLAAEEAEKERQRKQKEKELAEQKQRELELEKQKQKELQEQAKKAKEAAENERLRKENEEKERQDRLRREAEAQRQLEEKQRMQAAQPKPAGKTKKVEIQFQDEDEEENPDLIADEADGEPEPGQQDQQEPAKEEQSPQPAGRPVQPAATGKGNRRSFHFQDEDGEDHEEEEEEAEQEEAQMEEEAEKESNILLLNALTSNALIEEKKVEIIDKADRRKASILGALFALTMIGSIILWIILFRLLAVKNAHLGNVVLDIPTLGIYYPTYVHFYEAYNSNTDQMQAAMAQLGSEAQSPSEKRQLLLSFFTKKAELTKALGAVKERLSELTKPGRTLAGQETARLSLSELMERVEIALANLREETANTGGLGEKFREFYKNVLADVTKIYGDSLDMIDKYGEFFVMTNRIWVASENIFRVFENRAFEVLEEMTRHHYEPIRLEKDKISLTRTQFLSSSRVQELPATTIQTEKPAVLVCRASTEVDNADFSQLDRNFELALVLNNEQNVTRSPFKYKVTGKHDRFEFVNVLPLAAGTSELSLFALVELGDVKLANFRAFCVKFSDYAHLAEYKDFRLT